MAGLEPRAYWWAWALMLGARILVISVLGFALTKAFIFKRADAGVLFVLFLLQGVNVYGLLHLVIALCNSAEVANLVMWGTSVPGFLVMGFANVLMTTPGLVPGKPFLPSAVVKALCALLGPFSFSVAQYQLLMAEDAGERGLRWDRVGDVGHELGITFAEVLGCLAGTAVLYNFLAWCVAVAGGGAADGGHGN